MIWLGRGRKVTAEPGPGAVVEVAGRRIAWTDHLASYQGWRYNGWRVIYGEPVCGVFWLTWEQVLALGTPRLVLPPVRKRRG